MENSTLACSIVLVSKMKIMRKAIADMLSATHGMTVLGTFACASDALLQVEVETPDIILLDVADHGTQEAIACIVNLSPLTSIVASGIDSNPAEKDIVAYARAGVSGYITNDASELEWTEAIFGARRGEITSPGSVASCNVILA